MDIPQNLSAQAGNKQFDLTWDPCVNVTGYEVRITTEIEGEQKSDTVSGKGKQREDLVLPKREACERYGLYGVGAVCKRRMEERLQRIGRGGSKSG